MSAAVLTRPTIRDFQAGTVHSAKFVAAFFGKSKQWVRIQAQRGRLRASRIDGTGNWMIDGSSVLELYGKLLLASDAAQATATKLPEDRSNRAAKAAMKDLRKLNKGAK